MVEISVIIPVYNVEKYLNECIDSVLAQTHTDFELILVDDGSSDRSGQICDEYAVKDNRIKVIHQPNGGVSVARNTGLYEAKCEYITFVDSDDVVLPNYLSVLLKALKDTDSDISSCRSGGLVLKNTYSPEPQTTTCYIVSGKEASRGAFCVGEMFAVHPWGNMYKRNLWENVRFPVGKIHEDQAMLPKVYYKAKQCVLVEKKIYCYRHPEGSITNSEFNNKRFEDIDAIDSCIDFFSDLGEKEIVSCAKKRKLERIGEYVLKSYKAGKNLELPQEYKMSKLKALKLLRKSLPNDEYLKYLNDWYPNLIPLHEIVRKTKKAFGVTSTTYYKAQNAKTIEMIF